GGVWPPGRRRHRHLGENLVGAAGEVVDPVVAVEIGERKLPLPPRGYEPHGCAERDQSRRGVGGGGRDAALARGGDPADRAVLLQAEVDRLAPLVILVVVVAA